MNTLPKAGQINCTKCFNAENITFDETYVESKDKKWRLKNNPLAWGNMNAEIVVLGFSKGPTQAGNLLNTPHNEIAYKGHRKNIGKIFHYLGLLDSTNNENIQNDIDSLISDTKGRFHFASLIRCTVEQYYKNKWIGTSGNMLGKFVKTDFGKEIIKKCTNEFLIDLPNRTKLIIMFGLGTKLSYVQDVYTLFSKDNPDDWKMINDVSYSNNKITIVHVEHFASQGAHLNNWLGINDNKRKKLGIMAKEAVQLALK